MVEAAEQGVLGQLLTVQSFRHKRQSHRQHFMAPNAQLSTTKIVVQQCSCVPGHHALAAWTAALAGCSEGGRPSGWRPANRLKILSNTKDDRGKTREEKAVIFFACHRSLLRRQLWATMTAINTAAKGEGSKSVFFQTPPPQPEKKSTLFFFCNRGQSRFSKFQSRHGGIRVH